LRWWRQNCRRCRTPSQSTTSSRIHIGNDWSTASGAYVWKGPTSRVIVVSRAKVSFWTDGRTKPRNYRWIWYHCPYDTSESLVGCLFIRENLVCIYIYIMCSTFSWKPISV
jgi:hypothetical protein